MAVAIEKKIVGYAVNANTAAVAGSVEATQPSQLQQIAFQQESIPRPDILHGTTYKIKPAAVTHEDAIYITINDMEIDSNKRVPYEIFITSKNTDAFQWVAAMTRLISAVFRKGGEVKFLSEELQSIHDPRGGYFAKGLGYVPSVVAHIGIVIERHLEGLG